MAPLRSYPTRIHQVHSRSLRSNVSLLSKISSNRHCSLRALVSYAPRPIVIQGEISTPAKSEFSYLHFADPASGFLSLRACLSLSLLGPSLLPGDSPTLCMTHDMQSAVSFGHTYLSSPNPNPWALISHRDVISFSFFIFPVFISRLSYP